MNDPYRYHPRDAAPDHHPVDHVRPRIWRSRDNRMIAGVVGGLAERFAIDPGFARLAYVAISLFSAVFPGVLVYILLWLITKPHGRE